MKKSACSPTSWVLHLGVDLDSTTFTVSQVFFFQVKNNLSYKENLLVILLVALLVVHGAKGMGADLQKA